MQNAWYERHTYSLYRDKGVDVGQIRWETGAWDAEACALFDRAFDACTAEGPLQVLEAGNAGGRNLLCLRFPGDELFFPRVQAHRRRAALGRAAADKAKAGRRLTSPCGRGYLTERDG